MKNPHSPTIDATLAALLGRPATLTEVLKALDAKETPKPVKLPGELLTMKEASARLKVCKRHLYNLRDRGRLKIVYLGKAARIPLAEVERLADGVEA